MYTNNSMSNNNINKFYRPATWESICFNDPEKASVLSDYFEKIGWYPRKNGVPTVNLTYGIISPAVIHSSIWSGGMTTEYLYITESCKTGREVHIKGIASNTTTKVIDHCCFAYVADVPTSVLKTFIKNAVCLDFPPQQYKKLFEQKANMVNVTKEVESLKAENESLKKQLDTFKKSVENLYNMTTK